MYRCSNTVIGFLNLFTLLASIPIIGAGLWMAKTTSNTTTCTSFLQTPLLVIGFVVLIVSLAGFVGACFHVSWALWFYLFAMIVLTAALLCLTVFGFAVTAKGGGTPVPGRVYREYHLDDGYSTWLKNRVLNDKNWAAIRSCVVGSKSCDKIVTWTPVEYMHNDLTPIQSGCCKPPTACTYGETAVGMSMETQDPDCYKWNNAADVLCYACDSCRAGVAESVRREWHKVAVFLVVLLVVLVGIYSAGCCAYRNARRGEIGYPYGRNYMTKVRPRWDYHWWRWMHDQRDRLY